MNSFLSSKWNLSMWPAVRWYRSRPSFDQTDMGVPKASKCWIFCSYVCLRENICSPIISFFLLLFNKKRVVIKAILSNEFKSIPFQFCENLLLLLLFSIKISFLWPGSETYFFFYPVLFSYTRTFFFTKIGVKRDSIARPIIMQSWNAKKNI